MTKSRTGEYTYGEYESQKHGHLREGYYEYVAHLKKGPYSVEDFLQQFPAFVGHLTLARFLTFYEHYRSTLGLAGHIAEVGVYKGFGTLLFAKLVQIIEPVSLTQVHGFDWFKGMHFGKHDTRLLQQGCERGDYEALRELVRLQRLDHIVRIHKMDVTTGLGPFFRKTPHLQFRLVFLDAGTYDVVRAGIQHFWPRLVTGGILILDQFNHEFGQGETKAVRELLGQHRIRTSQFGWMPTAYVIKE